MNWFKNDFKYIYDSRADGWKNNDARILPIKGDQVWSEENQAYVNWEKHELYPNFVRDTQEVKLNVSKAFIKTFYGKDNNEMATTKSNLYRAAVIYQPKRSVDINGTDKTPPAILVVEPKNILAPSADIAKGLIFRDVPAEYLDKVEDLDVIVRDF